MRLASVPGRRVVAAPESHHVRPARGGVASPGALPGVSLRDQAASTAAFVPVLSAALAGLLLARACPPDDWSALAWLVPGLLLVPLRGRSVGFAFACGVLFALTFGLGATGWAYRAARAFFGLSPIAAGGFVALVWCLFGGVQYGLLAAAYAALAERVPLALRGLVAAWLWVGAELLRVHLFTGMPWELLGHTQHRWLAIVQIADLGGVGAVSFVVALASISLWEAAVARDRRWRARAAALGPAAVATAAALAYGTLALARPEAGARWAGTRTIALVQGNLTGRRHWQRAQAERDLARYAELSRAIDGPPLDLLVWPEYASSLYLEREPLLRTELAPVAARASSGLLLGSPRLEDSGAARNSALLIDPSGAVAARYDKRHLVPLAEIDPWRGPFSPAGSSGDPAFAGGDTAGVLDTPSMKVGVLICYESIFPGLVRDLAREGAQVLVNLTNESWLDGSVGGANDAPPLAVAARQQLSMAVLAAIEVRRALVRVATSGPSAVISARGEVLARLPEATTGGLLATVELGNGLTPFARWGEAWMVPSGLLILAAIALARPRPAAERTR